MEDLFSLLDGGGTPQIYASPFNLVDAWVVENGYYGISGMLYARMDDETCMPVPVEDISGFDGFVAALRRGYEDKRLVMDPSGLTDGETAGIVDTSPTLSAAVYALHADASKYRIIPLACFRTQPLPLYFDELAVSASSPRAEDIARFMQWTLEGEGYMLVNYGEQGKDYRMDDGRLTPLYNGYTFKPWDINPDTPDTPYIPDDNPGFFRDSALEPKQAGLPANYDEFVSGIPILSPPLWRAVTAGRRAWETDDSLDLAEYRDIQDKRAEFISGLFQNGEGGLSQDGEYAASLSGLLGMRADTERLVEACAEKIKVLVENMD